jgi:hypothetical protein
VPRIFSARDGSVAAHRQVESLAGLDRFTIATDGERPFPLEVDGDFVGEFESADFEAAPGSLSVVS